MSIPNNRQAWKDSLTAMRESLVSTYELGTAVLEQEQFMSAWNTELEDYVVFSDYRRNEGRRRLQDIMELIDHAMKKIDKSDPVTASAIYVETLREVAFLTKWAKVLESSAGRFSS
ncbi:MAG: hypothetical protein JSW61_11715 [Candidatus Thorarchaeota archaeon]|nr:MAG: hypothetical protein JSW61_11715 [Candidatus Thorarchaeota archaeon]